ncbi:TRAP transporter substrate-binding protein DctP [Stappia stellulata]|uniref:TRAP transporter substrate-binding protein DctP n=1 Tax=Stappia stellulata TaxID=71235 RepID=UPI00040AEF37|nr:TRAP transporter substrate-binding protein DctP [Stappia stellulata]
MIKMNRLAAMAGAVWLAGTAMANAETLRFAYGHPPGSYFDIGANVFAETVKENSGGALKVRTFPLSLLNLMETSDGISSGLADIGALMTTLFPREYPHANLAMETAMILLQEEDLSQEMQGVLYGAAMTDFIINDCPECHREFAARNNVFTVGTASTPYSLNCTKPHVELSDVKNARMRISGSYWARWSQAMEASPVTVSGNEMLEALSQGLIDCVVLSVPDVYNFGMGDLVTDITTGVPGGIYVASLAQVNRNTWAGLSLDKREALLRGAATAAAEISMKYENGLQELKEKSRNGEIKARFHQAAPSLVEATRGFVDTDIDTLVGYYRETFGVSNGEETVAAMRARVSEWRGHLDGVSTAEELAQLYWDEILSDVDLATYGQ